MGAKNLFSSVPKIGAGKLIFLSKVKQKKWRHFGALINDDYLPYFTAAKIKIRVFLLHKGVIIILQILIFKRASCDNFFNKIFWRGAKGHFQNFLEVVNTFVDSTTYKHK